MMFGPLGLVSHVLTKSVAAALSRRNGAARRDALVDSAVADAAASGSAGRSSLN